jgi:DNA invertase Pin-like site-specific DNA recombinase
MTEPNAGPQGSPPGRDPHAPHYKAVAAYIRVSTDHQEMEIQRGAIQDLARGLGVEVSRWYDETRSGIKHRPELDRLLEHVASGHVGTVLVYAVDRLGRSMLDVVKKVLTLEQAQCRLVTYRERFDSRANLGPGDTQGALGKAMIVMLAAFADIERQTILDRTRLGMRRARDIGKTLGHPATEWLPGQKEAMIAAMARGEDFRGISAAALAIGPFHYRDGARPPKTTPLSKKRTFVLWDKWHLQGIAPPRPNTRKPTGRDWAAEEARMSVQDTSGWSPFPPGDSRRGTARALDTILPQRAKPCPLAPITAEQLAELPVVYERRSPSGPVPAAPPG